MKFTSPLVVAIVALFIASNYVTVVDSKQGAFDVMLEERARSGKDGKSTSTASLLHKKNPAMAKLMAKKQAQVCSTPLISNLRFSAFIDW